MSQDQMEVEGGVRALVAGEGVAVFRTHEDEVYALSNYDPFSWASVLARGTVGTRWRSLRRFADAQAGLDLRTGQCLDDEEARVPSYEVRVVGAGAGGSTEGRSLVSDAVGDAVARSTAQPLAGFRVGVTARRKVEEQVTLLERRGAVIAWAPVLSLDPDRVDDEQLRASTEEVLSRPVDLFLATTGIGMRAWLDFAGEWGLLEDLVAALGRAEILARGTKSVGALRKHGLRELWSPASERFEDVLEHLRGRDLTGLRIVVQEHGRSLSMAAHALRRQGADVTTVVVYRVAGAEDPEPVFGMVDRIADGELDAVTFTSEAFELWGVPTIYPDRSRTAAMIKLLEVELPSRSHGTLHAAEMAVARLRSAVGTRLVQTVVKRGYRLAVEA